MTTVPHEKGLNPTGARLALMRSIAAEEISVGRWGDGRLVIALPDGSYGDGRMVNRFHELTTAKLVRGVHVFQNGYQPAELTAAGRQWLADHDRD